MKGGASIQELKTQLGEVNEMIPNKIEEIKQNTAYKGVVTLAGKEGEEKFEDNLFKPLEELNKTIKGPIDDIETKIKGLESNFNEGKVELIKEVNAQFTTLKEEFEKQYDSVIKELIKVIEILPPVQTAQMTGMNPLDLFKTFMNQIKDQLLDMIDKKKEDILKQIEELTPDDILNKAVETAEKTIKEPAEEPAEKPTEEEPAAEDANNPTEDAVKTIVENLTSEEKKEYENEVENAKIAAAQKYAGPEDAAELAAKKIEEMAKEIGGKKKSKGKK